MTAAVRRWLAAGVLALVLAAAAVTRADPDLWGHVRFGLDTLAARHLTSADPYSFTQDLRWINHEWLSEAQMGAAYLLAGAAGLALLKATLVVAVLVLVWSGLSRVHFLGRLIVALLVIMGTVHMWATVRPQLWTLLGLALLCRILVSDRGLFSRLPALFVVWVNCHGGWIVGLGVLAAWSLGGVLRRPAQLARWLVILGSCALATLVNPYGWHLWAFMVQTIRVHRSISEWGPLWGTPWINWLPWGAAVAATAWSVLPLSWSRLRERIPSLFALMMLGAGAARVMRIESLFVVAAAILLSEAIAAKWPTRPAPMTVPADAGLALGALGLAMVATAIPVVRVTASCVRGVGDWVPDRGAARLLASAEPGRLVTFFDWGEYAIWQFGPRLRVSMDGRRETVYSDTRIAEHDAIMAGSSAGLAALQSWRPEYVWLPERSVATKNWLLANGYRLDVETPQSFVAVRADLPRLAAQVGRPPADCFPE
jgi:hypothetical protein